VLIKEIDRLNSQPAKARIAGTANIPGRAVHAADAFCIKAEAKLSCDDDTLARNLAQEAPEQFLVFVRAVNFGGIQEVAAQLQISAKNSKGLFFIGWAVSGRHSHAPKP
jgi:hypothetical protein